MRAKGTEEQEVTMKLDEEGGGTKGMEEKENMQAEEENSGEKEDDEG